MEKEVIHYGYYPCSVEGPCVAPAATVDHLPWFLGAFTSMFMHASWIHIGGNMLFLWIFGNNVEDSMGRTRFLVWYLLAGLAATATQTVVTLATTDAAGASIPNIGASGAIAGVLGAYLLLLPQASVLTAFIIGLVFLREIPAYWFIGFWFLLQLVEGGFSIVAATVGRRHRLLRPCRRLCLRAGDRAALCRATALTAGLVSSGVLTGIAIAAGVVALVVLVLYLFGPRD